MRQMSNYACMVYKATRFKNNLIFLLAYKMYYHLVIFRYVSVMFPSNENDNSDNRDLLEYWL